MKPSSLPAFLSRFLARAALLATDFLAGCTSVQVTDDNKTLGEYKLGYLIVQPTQSFEKTREATRKAFQEMGYFLVQDEFDPPGSGELRARTPNDTTVELKLKSFGSYTNVKIRHGLRGELAPAQQLYQAIAKNF